MRVAEPIMRVARPLNYMRGVKIGIFTFRNFLKYSSDCVQMKHLQVAMRAPSMRV